MSRMKTPNRDKLFKGMSKSELVILLREYAAGLKDGAIDTTVDEKVARQIQDCAVNWKAQLGVFNFENLTHTFYMSKVSQAKTKEELADLLERAEGVSSKMAGLQASSDVLCDVIVSVADRPEVLSELLDEIVLSVATIINKLGNSVEQSGAVDLSPLDVMERKMANLPSEEELKDPISPDDSPEMKEAKRDFQRKENLSRVTDPALFDEVTAVRKAHVGRSDKWLDPKDKPTVKSSFFNKTKDDSLREDS